MQTPSGKARSGSGTSGSSASASKTVVDLFGLDERPSDPTNNSEPSSNGNLPPPPSPPIQTSSQPSRALQNEMAVLGEMFLDPGAAAVVQGILCSDDFALDRHRIIYAGILRCLNEHGQVDTLLLQEDLDRNGTLRRAGGLIYLAELLDNTITVVNSERHAKLVLEESQIRSLSRSAIEVLQLKKDGKPLHELIGAAQRGLLDLRGPRVSGRHESLADLIPRSIDALECRITEGREITGIPTSISQLDALNLGWHPEELAVVAARAGTGKTALMLQMAKSAAEGGYRVAIQSLEMSAVSLTDRLIISTAGVPGQAYRRGQLSRVERDRVVEATSRLHSLPITADESTGQTIHDIRSKVRSLKATHPDLALFFVDYVQLIKPTGAMESHRLEQSLASAALKEISRELKIAVVGLSQVSRPQQGTEYRRPFMSHLKESGSWEQDSDVVLIIHRPDAADAARAKKEGKTGICEFWLEKQRNGPTGHFETQFIKSEMAFRPLDSRPGFP